MNFGKTFWGLLCIFAAAVLILDALNVLVPIENAIGGVSVLALLAGVFLLAYILKNLFGGRLGSIFVPLGLMFMLFEKNIATLCGAESANLINNWLVLLISVLLATGVDSLLPKRKRFKFIKIEGIGRKEKTLSEDRDYTDNSLGSSVVYIDCEDFVSKTIENNIGSCSVHFVSPEEYEGGGVLCLENNLGHLIVNVPSDWNVKCDIENNLGHVSGYRACDGNERLLYIRGENNLGKITIEYIE